MESTFLRTERKGDGSDRGSEYAGTMRQSQMARRRGSMLTQSRLGTFHGGHFADVNLSSVLFTHRIDNREHVQLEVWSAPGLTKPTFEEALKQKFKPAKKGDSFGPSCESYLPRC